MLICHRYLELLQKNKSKIPAVDISKIKEVTPLPACDASTPPVLVLGGDNDYSVDIDGLQETADHYGVQPVILPGLAHDMMLVWILSKNPLLRPTPILTHVPGYQQAWLL